MSVSACLLYSDGAGAALAMSAGFVVLQASATSLRMCAQTDADIGQNTGC